MKCTNNTVQYFYIRSVVDLTQETGKNILLFSCIFMKIKLMFMKYILILFIYIQVFTHNLLAVYVITLSPFSTPFSHYSLHPSLTIIYILLSPFSTPFFHHSLHPSPTLLYIITYLSPFSISIFDPSLTPLLPLSHPSLARLSPFYSHQGAATNTILLLDLFDRLFGPKYVCENEGGRVGVWVGGRKGRWEDEWVGGREGGWFEGLVGVWKSGCVRGRFGGWVGGRIKGRVC